MEVTMAKRRKFSADFKAEVVLQVLTGVKSQAEVCREHQLSSQLFGTWKRQFLENAARAFEKDKRQAEDEAQIGELERLAGRLTMQLEIAKKASRILQSHRANDGR
jgi:transposase-like protein